MHNSGNDPIGVFSIGALVFRQEIVTQLRQQAKKKHIDNRYDYTLHARQDDKHHDNARTN